MAQLLGFSFCSVLRLQTSNNQEDHWSDSSQTHSDIFSPFPRVTIKVPLYILIAVLWQGPQVKDLFFSRLEWLRPASLSYFCLKIYILLRRITDIECLMIERIWIIRISYSTWGGWGIWRPHHVALVVLLKRRGERWSFNLYSNIMGTFRF